MPRTVPLQIAILAALLAGCTGCTLFGGNRSDEVARFSSPEARRDWWRANKDRAEFVPGRGYAVAGVPGYFDEHGHPMQGDLGRVNQVGYEAAMGAEAAPISESWVTKLDPARNIQKLKDSFKPKPNARLARQNYDEGEKLFQEKKYAAAEDKFESAAELAPDTALEEDALFMEAECQFFSDRYPSASDSYTALVKKYSNTRHLDTVIARQFSIAQYWLKLHERNPHWAITPILFDKTRYRFDTRGHALRTFENIWLNDPTGPLADDALMATANSHFISGRYADADYYYEQVRKEFPESEHQYQAHLLGLQCKLRKYQGPDYDVTPLEEAEKLAEQLLVQFPNQIGDERERVAKIRSQIAASRAERDWKIAEYYASLRSYGAARFYYREIINDYPGTKLAQAAHERLDEFGDRPDVPAQPLEWLVNLFPNGKKTPVVASGAPTGTRR